MQTRAGRSRLPLEAGVLSLAWIVTILPVALRFASGPERVVPDHFGFSFDWRHFFLGGAAALGSAVAWVDAMAWAWWAGAYSLKIGLWKPWKVESWILDASRFGGAFAA